MKTKIFSKKLLVTLSIVLIAVMALLIAGCSNKTQTGTLTEPPVSTTASTTEAPAVTEVGEGQTSFTFIVVDLEGKETTFNVKTTKTNVGEALVDANLIAGEESEFGLYVKTVNGITVDFDKDGKYWAFYVDDEQSPVGVDSVEIEEGKTYSFKAE